ncbi:MAG: zinc ribbon domain-containing protein [Candidatus Odinarchaeota archaeon]
MSNSNLEMRWINFGKSIHIVAVFWIFILIPFFAFLAIGIQFIFIVIALNEIKNINRQLSNLNLGKFFSKCLAGNIIKAIGLIVVNVGGLMLFGGILSGQFHDFFLYYSYFSLNFIWMYPILTIVFAVGFIFTIIGSGIEKGAWENLNIFLNQNDKMFPVWITIDPIEGTNKLSRGALLWALGFLIIPIIIGWIFYIIGYFKLSKFSISPSMKQLPPSIVPESRPTPISVPETIDVTKYCPHCGSEIDEEGRYCGNCGSPLHEN